MRTLSICLASAFALALAACGDDGSTADIDAARPIDAPVTIDAAIDSPMAAPTCAAYCTAVVANCTGANRQYDAQAAMVDCMANCAYMPVGTLADTSGNTLGCRLYHGGMPAQMNPALHCIHAGPTGGGACGPMQCDGFCQTVMGACVGANQQYGGQVAACRTACGMFNTMPPYTAAVTTGNSFACRMYHATKAALGPGTHCSHTAAISSTCVAPAVQ